MLATHLVTSPLHTLSRALIYSAEEAPEVLGHQRQSPVHLPLPWGDRNSDTLQQCWMMLDAGARHVMLHVPLQNIFGKSVAAKAIALDRS